jgi:hypothetical protein
MKGECQRWQECELFKTKKEEAYEGCGFKHFDRILEDNHINEILSFIGDKHFRLCSTGNRSRGGRVALDQPVRELFKARFFPRAKEISPSEEILPINGDSVKFKAKYDGGFCSDGKYFFYEIKGYGDNTNDVLSAISAAQLLKTLDKYRNSAYFYIGISTGKKGYETKLHRSSFLDPKRTKIYPYVRWAESRGLLKFYGIVDIDDLVREASKFLFEMN